jgi:hypothetical protein
MEKFAPLRIMDTPLKVLKLNFFFLVKRISTMAHYENLDTELLTYEIYTEFNEDHEYLILLGVKLTLTKSLTV